MKTRCLPPSVICPLSSALIILALLLSQSVAQAATLIWDSNFGTTGAQDGGGNWTVGGATFYNFTTSTDNQATTNNINTDIAQFGNGGTLVSAATVNVSTQSINGLVFGATTTSGYTLTASTTGRVLTIGGSGITLNSGTQPISLGDASLGITMGAVQSWTNNSTSLFTVAGAVRNGGFLLTVGGSGDTTISGAFPTNNSGGLTKNDGGTLTLTGSYAGNTVTVNGGTVIVNPSSNDQFNPSSGSVVINNGGTFKFGGSNKVAGSVGFTVNTGGILDVNGQTDTIGTIAGSGTIQNSGAASPTMILDMPSSQTFDGTITGSMNLYFRGNLAGGVARSLTLTNTGNNFTGNIIINNANTNIAGDVSLVLGNSGVIPDASLVTINGSSTASGTGSYIGILDMNGKNETIAGLAGGAPTNTGTRSGSVTNNGSSDSTLTLNIPAGTPSFAGIISDGSTNKLALIKTGAGTQTLSGANTYSGNTTITQGTLKVGVAGAIPNGSGKGSVVFDTAANTATFDLNGIDTTINGLSQSTASTTNRVVNNATGTNKTLTVGNNDATSTFAGIIANNTGGTGTLALTKTGTGTQILTGANTYTGATNISGGALQLGSGGSTGSIANSSSISVGAGATLRTSRDGSITLGQAITGAGNVEISNATTGSTILGNASNAYTGTTMVTSGSLQVGAAGTGKTGTGAVTVQNGSTILGTGVLQGSSFTAASGSSIYAGDSTAQGSYGTLTFTPVSGSGAIDFQSGSTTYLGIDPGGTSDLINITGTGTNTFLFNGNLTVGPASFTPLTMEVFNLIDWAGLTAVPTFASRYTYTGLLSGNGDEASGLDLPDISGSGFFWDISQFTTNGSIAIVVVPEPSRALLLAFGLAGLLLRRRSYQA